ncbi:MAG: hypothetical protein ACRCW3_02740 [Metamycoplasmataceae bacterium]
MTDGTDAIKKLWITLVSHWTNANELINIINFINEIMKKMRGCTWINKYY